MAAIDVALEDTAEDGDPRDQLTRSPNDASDVAAVATCLHDVLDVDDERVDAVRRQFEEDLGVYSVGEAWELFQGNVPGLTVSDAKSLLFKIKTASEGAVEDQGHRDAETGTVEDAAELWSR
ncbi:hypothetical protein VOLCADRAFT_93694 [Volvox carteri f. nagariensis]|uniref:Uncharacterized protein n=1 Tax=Volvox carteri f. nagariensis TaxID=3068 RepID=D8U2T2_VOLCA|nr:uncharacterized protein VOLCADRAFT_93693 [Volvox carteri f. nagariensis]XP_002953035.1 uncharacterized protein VOLCADRAFT_93694 [Volvox carteri f. nagariensis]EFJ45956.1 hypothetical protein VOLCADRAFT_93693 [Volvox carteri f. nagariensis]EFJ45957.1 hypothetical protein VOLCADRAFT_93694 [Volvox carteri f. nagariensis]|eukprot:XP_002953034.1 hypothetical protein VOLCADRAFT_93693 [Volvox carteri f. nagariensis]